MKWPAPLKKLFGSKQTRPSLLPAAGFRAVTVGFTGLGIVLSVLVALTLWTRDAEGARLRFGAEAQVAATAIQQRIDFAIHDLDAVHSLFVASQDVSRDEFNAFVTLHQKTSDVPGLIRLEWVSRVRAQDRTTYEQTMRGWGLPGFQISERNADGALRGAGERNLYFPVTFLAPEAGNEALLGYDLASDPAHSFILQAAADSGQPQVVVVAHGGGRTVGRGDVFVVQPVHRGQELVGFVIGIYSLEKLVASAQQALPPWTADARDLYLYDESAPAGSQLIAFIPARPDALRGSEGGALSPSAAQTGMYFAAPLAIEQRRWLLVARPAPGATLGAPAWLPPVVLVMGLGLTALFVAYLRRRQQAEQALRRERTLLRTLLDSIPDLVYYRDTNLDFLGCNHAYESMHGGSEAELIAQDQRARRKHPTPGAGEEADRAVIATGSPQRQRQWLTTAAGARQLFDTLKTPLYGPHGEIAGVLEVSREVTAMWRSEQALAARLELSEYASGHKLVELLQECIDRVEALTDSKIGLFHFLEGDELEPSPQAWSTNTLATVCTVDPRLLHDSPSRAGIWSECIRTRRPIIYNDVAAVMGCRHFPPGHAPVQRFMVAPILRSDRVVAVIGVGNKRTPYDASDLALMTELAESLWDIVMRKRAEDALLVNLEKYRVLFESFPLGITITDKMGGIVEANTESVRLLGVSVAQHTQRTIFSPEWQVVRPDGAPLPAEEYAPVRALTENRLVRDMRMGIVNPDRPITWINVTAAPIPLEDYGLAIAYSDITDQMRMERAQAAQYAVSRILAESLEIDEAAPRLLKALAQELGWQLSEFWWCGEDGACMVLRHAWHAPNAAALAEFTAASQAIRFAPGLGLVGRVWAQGKAIWVDPAENGAELLRRALAEQAGLRSALAVPVSADGHAVGVISLRSHFALPEDPRLLATLTDIGRQIGQYVARKAAEAELKAERLLLAQRVEERTHDLTQANERLAHALRAKDEFLATMSHELRTPLHGILTLSETLLDHVRGPINDSQRRAVTLIAQSGRHLLELINDILDLSKVEAGKLTIEPATVAVLAVCQGSLQLVSEMALKKGVHLALEVEDSSLEVCADPRRLRQILINLLSNGVKFTPGGGSVCLRAAAVPERSVVQFSVTDTGIGIGPEDLGKLFQPFTQLDASLSRSYEGTGLGLALVRRLVELHGGSVEAHSAGVPGGGSEFIVTLPLSRDAPCRPHAQAEPEEATPQPGAAPAAQSPRRAKVLLAEDNELNRTALGDYLEACGYELIYAQNGQEALELAAALQPDIVLMDIQMPVLDGLKAIRRLRADPEVRSIPVIALTALAMVGDRDRCIAAGADDYLDKPVTLRLLRQKIDAILHMTDERNLSVVAG